MTNDAQLPMMKSMLMSAMKAGIDMTLFHCYILASQKEAAAYNTPEFKSLTTRKLELIVQNTYLDEDVLWVDNDIHFFNDCTVDVLSKSGNFIMQNDIWSPCTGFFLVRGNEPSRTHLKRAIAWLKANPSPLYNDQHAFRACMSPIIGIDRIHLLDTEQYPNGKIYFNLNKKSKARMVHCNFMKTTPEKVKRLKDHGFWNESDEAFYKTDLIFL